MNKEQKKPQELFSATLPRRICYLCEEEIPCEHYRGTETPQEPREEKEGISKTEETTRKLISEIFVRWSLPTRQVAITEIYQLINTNFIAKRDLRKLLEEKKRVMAHIVGSKRVETPYVVIDDILAELKI